MRPRRSFRHLVECEQDSKVFRLTVHSPSPIFVAHLIYVAPNTWRLHPCPQTRPPLAWPLASPRLQLWHYCSLPISCLCHRPWSCFLRAVLRLLCGVQHCVAIASSPLFSLLLVQHSYQNYRKFVTRVNLKMYTTTTPFQDAPHIHRKNSHHSLTPLSLFLLHPRTTIKNQKMMVS